MAQGSDFNAQTDEASRMTPIGWFHYAASYALSARFLTVNKVEATHPDAPIRHLYRHSIELYLKAFLLHSGVEAKVLKDKYGHNTERLAAKARQCGLGLLDEQFAQIAFCNDPLPDRYLVTGSRTVLTEETLLSICRHLHSAIGPQVYTSAGITRDPPFL